jgi:hypothetical protein
MVFSFTYSYQAPISPCPAFPLTHAAGNNRGPTEHLNPDASAQSASCRKLLNKMVGERTYSAQETAHLLLGIPLVGCSMTFHSLNIASEGTMREIEAREMEFNEDGERVVTGESWLQRYMKRSVEIDNLSLHDVMQQYSWRNGEWRQRRSTTQVIVRVFPRLSLLGTATFDRGHGR